MNTQPSSLRGFSSLLIILLVAAVAGIFGYFWIQTHSVGSALTASSTPETSTSSANTVKSEVPVTASTKTSIDTYFWKEGSGVYYVADRGDVVNPLATTTVAGADSATFTKIGEYPSTSNEGHEINAYYKDKAYVYYFASYTGIGGSRTYFATVDGADPQTFVLVNGNDQMDGKDKNHTYLRGKIVN